MIKIIKFILLFLFAYSAHAFADEFNYARLAANVAVIADWAQTRDIADSNNYYETNNLLGDKPTTGEVNRHFISFLIAYNVIGEFVLDEKNSVYFYTGVAMGHTSEVIKNYQIGIKFKF